MRVGVASDVDQESRVVDGSTLILVEPDQLAETQRDQALTKDVLHRLPESEVDSERQRRHELGETNRLELTGLAHARSVLVGAHGGSEDEANTP